MLGDGNVGLLGAPKGKLERVLRFTIGRGKITQVEIVAGKLRLAELELPLIEA